MQAIKILDYINRKEVYVCKSALVCPDLPASENVMHLLPSRISAVLPPSFNTCRYSCFNFLRFCAEKFLRSLHMFCCKLPNSIHGWVYCARTSVGGWLVLISRMYRKMFAAIKVCDFQPLTKFAQLMACKHMCRVISCVFNKQINGSTVFYNSHALHTAVTGKTENFSSDNAVSQTDHTTCTWFTTKPLVASDISAVFHCL